MCVCVCVWSMYVRPLFVIVKNVSVVEGLVKSRKQWYFQGIVKWACLSRAGDVMCELLKHWCHVQHLKNNR